MNEAETRAELIDPAIKSAGWGVVDGSRVRREVITLGRLQGAGTRAKPDIADYVLVYKNQKLAVIEAKRERAPVTEGLDQAKEQAGAVFQYISGYLLQVIACQLIVAQCLVTEAKQDHAIH